MLLDIIDGVLTLIDSPASLRPDQVGQIYFWGFIKAIGSDVYKQANGEASGILLKLQAYFDKEGISYHLSESCQQTILNLQKIAAHLEQAHTTGGQFKAGNYDVNKFDNFCSFAKSNIHRSLKNHQLKAAYHLYLVGNGANFSVPGSGKTAVILTVYEKLRIEGKVDTLYVVGPPACFAPWRTEFKLTLGRNPDFRILAGGQQEHRKLEYYSPLEQKAELYLTTFQTLLNDQDNLISFLNQYGNKMFFVVDEAHYMKQIGGSWSNAVLNSSEHAKYRCILTGTPMPKSYTDVFNLFDFLWPYKGPLDSDTKVIIKLQEDANDMASAKVILNRDIGPLFYRVRKSELGLTSPIFHPVHLIPMNRYEGEIYSAIQRKIVDYTKQDYLRNIEIVNRLRRCRIIRLRQCVSYIKLLFTALENYKENLVDEASEIARIIYEYDNIETPAKIQYLIKLVNDLRNGKQKVVIWSHFRGALELIIKKLTEAGLNCKLIYGSTPIENSIAAEETREQIRDEFIDINSGLDILVANPAACGESVSLHKTCFHAIYYDLSYNCAQYLQSLDRIHRVGGSETNQANYHFLQYEDTIEQDIRSNLEAKAMKMQSVIDEDYAIYTLDMFEGDEDLQAYNRLFR